MSLFILNLKKWLVPPGFIHLWRYTFRYLNKDKVDLRRFWAVGVPGVPIEPAGANIKYFGSFKTNSRGITRAKETRDCLVIKAGQEVELELPLIEEASDYRFGFGSEITEKSSIEVISNGDKVISLNYLKVDEWCDTLVSTQGLAKHITIRNLSNNSIYLSRPVPHVSPKNNDIQNVIVILLDSLMSNTVRAKGMDGKVLTPNINRFFKKADYYQNCYSVSEWTLPSIYSMLSSTYPITHGFSNLGKLAPSGWGDLNDTLAPILQEAGFSTMACSTGKMFTPAFGSHAGFDRFFYDPYPQSGRTCELISSRAIEHLQANKEGKNFLFLHLIDAHEPFVYPSFSENCEMSPDRIVDPLIEYSVNIKGFGDSKSEPIFNDDGVNILKKRHEIRMRSVDLHMQGLFSYLENSGMVDSSAVILTGDHGCAYFQQDKHLLNDSRTHVELSILHPDQKGFSDQRMVNLGVDFAPTLLDIVGLTMPTEDGKIITQNKGFVPRKYVISESVFRDKYKASVRTQNISFFITCQYDISTKTIFFNKNFTSSLFDVSKGKITNWEQSSWLDSGNHLIQVAKDHLQNNAKKFNVIFD
jgi:hypothetical protein